jgi:hypothetical protein
VFGASLRWVSCERLGVCVKQCESWLSRECWHLYPTASRCISRDERDANVCVLANCCSCSCSCFCSCCCSCNCGCSCSCCCSCGLLLLCCVCLHCSWDACKCGGGGSGSGDDSDSDRDSDSDDDSESDSDSDSGGRQACVRLRPICFRRFVGTLYVYWSYGSNPAETLINTLSHVSLPRLWLCVYTRWQSWSRLDKLRPVAIVAYSTGGPLSDSCCNRTITASGGAPPFVLVELG